MSGNNKALLDTKVIILASKNEINTTQLVAAFDKFYTSIINFMDAYGYEFENQDEDDFVGIDSDVNIIKLDEFKL